MGNSFIAKKDLDSEMTVVRNEYEMGENSPFRVTYQRLLSAAFNWHNDFFELDIEPGVVDRAGVTAEAPADPR